MARIIGIDPEFKKLAPKGDYSMEAFKQEQSALDKLHEEFSDKATLENPLGFIHKIPIADGYALYRVAKVRPLSLYFIPFGDRWQARDAEIRGLRLSDIQQGIKFRDMWRELTKRNAEKRAGG